MTACLTDFGVAALMTDPTVVGSDSEERFLPGFARYMAPELIDPQTLGPSDRKPTKHSDIYSFAITAYEVRLSRTARGLCSHCRSAIRFSQGLYRISFKKAKTSPVLS